MCYSQDEWTAKAVMRLNLHRKGWWRFHAYTSQEMQKLRGRWEVHTMFYERISEMVKCTIVWLCWYHTTIHKIHQAILLKLASFLVYYTFYSSKDTVLKFNESIP